MSIRTTLSLSLWLSGCLDVAEERARRDLEVGRTELAGASVEVEDGLAAVRALSSSALELWANAPALRFRLALADDAATSFRLVVQNALPEAELTVTANGGAAVSFSELEAQVPTERMFSIERGSSRNLVLELSPSDLSSDEPFEFIALADVQEAIDRVNDVFVEMNEQSGARFAMFSGDVTSRGGRAELERFQREMRALRMPLYTTLGNHELGDSEVPYHDYFGRGSQSFRFHGVRFTFLDSASATLDPLVYGWLRRWLDASRNENHLVFMHVPPLDPSGIRNGAFSSRAEAAKLLSLLGRGGVDTTFYGHIHSYYPFENAGIPAYISGGGGAIPERFDGIGRHFLRVAVDPQRAGTDVHVVRVD
jgi:hypothetical protein